ncbi:MAG: ABC transporter permease [Ignavibacteriae bacterium]|nr:ABC transporter permease [Ignavibacteriota bacterium]
MKIPISYTWRSLWTRRMTTILTLTGIALVVFVFAAVLMLAQGVEDTLVETGSEDNIIILRKAANSELVSQIDRDAANILKTLPEIALSNNGKPLLTTDISVIINLSKKETMSMGNISVRGISAEAMQLRESVKLSSGRIFEFGTHEIIIGDNIAELFIGAEVGKEIKFGGETWMIVGTFSSEGNAFESEIWADVEQMMQAFGRPVFSSITFKMNNPEQFESLKSKIQQDPRTNYVDVKREQDFYKEQSKLMADFIKLLGLVVTIIFSVGAMIGAMITMYAAVANRTIEVGTLRALGFKRRSVLSAFLVESIVLSLIGGGAGIALASIMSFVQISTTNFGTFSELAFGFDLSVSVITSSMIFSVIMGILGGFLPSVRAARLNIVNALRSS